MQRDVYIFFAGFCDQQFEIWVPKLTNQTRIRQKSMGRLISGPPSAMVTSRPVGMPVVCRDHGATHHGLQEWPHDMSQLQTQARQKLLVQVVTSLSVK